MVFVKTRQEDALRLSILMNSCYLASITEKLIIMIKKITILVLLAFASAPVFAQYSTPGNGGVYTLDDLVAQSEGALTQVEGVYFLHEDLQIAVSDTLQILQNGSLLIAPELRITVSGVLKIDAPESFLMDCSEEGEKFEGVHVEVDANIDWNHLVMQNGGGIRLLTELTASITNSEFYDNYGGVATGAVFSISRGSHIIENNRFIGNDTPAVASAGNATASPSIIGNYIEANNQGNSNRPQINMGPTGVATDTIKIINNTIIGDRDKTRVGGISVSALIGGNVNAIVRDNIIKDNRYGVTIAGPNVWSEIKGNIIEDNDTEGLPNLGGSGINLLTQNPTKYDVFITQNQIRRNLWGITMQNDAMANLGDNDINPGNNVFADNGNNGQIFALYNNTSNDIMAMHNCWTEDPNITLEDAEDVIFHNHDDSTLGVVTFDPVSCAILGIEELTESKIILAPNPASQFVVLHGVSAFNQAIIYDVLGKEVSRFTIEKDSQQIDLNLKSGVYFVRIQNNQQQVTRKLVVK